MSQSHKDWSKFSLIICLILIMLWNSFQQKELLQAFSSLHSRKPFFTSNQQPLKPLFFKIAVFSKNGIQIVFLLKTLKIFEPHSPFYRNKLNAPLCFGRDWKTGSLCVRQTWFKIPVPLLSGHVFTSGLLCLLLLLSRSLPGSLLYHTSLPSGFLPCLVFFIVFIILNKLLVWLFFC